MRMFNWVFWKICQVIVSGSDVWSQKNGISYTNIWKIYYALLVKSNILWRSLLKMNFHFYVVDLGNHSIYINVFTWKQNITCNVQKLKGISYIYKSRRFFKKKCSIIFFFSRPSAMGRPTEPLKVWWNTCFHDRTKSNIISTIHQKNSWMRNCKSKQTMMAEILGL